VKPLDSAAFQAAFSGSKHLTAASWAQLEPAMRAFAGARLEFMIVEMIPGPDTQLCSYYTHMGEDGPAVDFTKRIVRRQPPGEGQATLHVTEWLPEVKALALRLLRDCGLRGLAAVEFKRDPRDGILKLMEANVRFTGCNAIVASAGVDLPSYVYARLTGRPFAFPPRFREGRRLWNPRRDLQSALILRRRGELTIPAWLRSLRLPAEMFYLVPDDPMPGLGGVVETGRRLLRFARRGGRKPTLG
jgi:D-aspartate ligase